MIKHKTNKTSFYEYFTNVLFKIRYYNFSKIILSRVLSSDIFKRNFAQNFFKVLNLHLLTDYKIQDDRKNFKKM